MENNASKGQKLLTPMLLASAALSITMPAMAYDHEQQITITDDGVKIGNNVIQHTSGTQTKNPYTGMPFDTDTD